MTYNTTGERKAKAGYYGYDDNGIGEASRAIQKMNPNDLSKLMKSDEEVQKFVQTLSAVRELETVKDSLKESNKNLALRNLEKEPILLNEKQKLTALHAELRKAKESYDSVKLVYDEKNGETTPEMLYILLQTAASDLDRDTEQTADNFFNRKRTEDEVIDFERRFIEERKRAHELRIKAEKFHECMANLQVTGYLSSNLYMRPGAY